MDATRIVELINQETEMNPDIHDGSYELMREIVKSYSKIDDYSMLDFWDLNAVYAMAMGTWKLNVEKKKEYVNSGHLPNQEKEKMTVIIDDIWDRACRGTYTNSERKGPSIGMFGTGFYSFERKADEQSCQRFIKLLVDIADINEDDKIFDLCDEVFDSSFTGMQAAAASVMLHCLKPFVFPIINTNSGEGTVYPQLEIELEKPDRLSTYISNCRKIKKFRDDNLVIRNYRILDLFPRKYKITADSEFYPSLEEYDPGLTAEDYHDLFIDESVVKRTWLEGLYELYKMPDHSGTCKQLGNTYGYAPAHYISYLTTAAEKIALKTNCPLLSPSEENGRYWPVLFVGKQVSDSSKGTYCWKMREQVVMAIETLIDEGIFKNTVRKKTMPAINVNTILYGPPGTGKTFNTIIYAVSIVEEKPLQEIQTEAVIDYKAVKDRFEAYKQQGRIAFTTFHQSYGYEDFIEGIRPSLDETDTNLEYSITDGVFKEFCKKASVPSNTRDKASFGLNSDPSIWKVSLAKTYDNPVRKECMENNHIRIGFDEYGEDLSESWDTMKMGYAPLNAFYNKMAIGDIVLSCYTNETIDAIGVVTGDVEFHGEYNVYKRVRNVKWLVKGINENIVAINGGAKMTLSTVYQMKISLSDVINLVDKYSKGSSIVNTFDNNYVFIIDEINRGNISKIFGELITLVEESKRIGAREELRVKLPYSHQQFGVPKNVYILGTMNTADRSIAIMDTALRRRFSFVEMLPDSDMLRQMGNPTIISNGVSVNIADMLDVINDRIAFLYDREHTIGHAFFMPLIANSSIDMLAMIFEKSIIPLLQEYFYEDYAKIQLVLGDDGKTGDKKPYQFISDEDVEAYSIFETVQELDSEKKYTINYPAFRSIESYKYISKKL